MSKVEKRLQNYLVLNRYLSSLFGFKDFEDFRRILKQVPEGISQHKKLYFTERLLTCRISDEFRQKINLYDENIQAHLDRINQKRDPPYALKYFQYLAVLFTEIYLDRFFNEFDLFYADLTKFIVALNTSENRQGEHTYPYPSSDSLRKLAYWSATGSGKTIIMHINMLQFLTYCNTQYDNLLLITPNGGLSTQHIKELDQSGIEYKRFEVQKTLEDWTLSNPIKVIEITKIRQEVTSQDGETVPVEAFGNNNVLFVDEGHKGHSTLAQTWKTNRKELVSGRGFTFEYSATFGEITDKEDTFNEYASSIIFDYRYKYFYEDGFGKDYNILNLKNKDEYGDEYFTGALLSFYEQRLYYKAYNRQIRPFNLESPLMIFVGSTVSGKETDSDVLNVARFIARFANEKKIFEKHIQNILTDKSSLVDENDQPFFSSKFPYLRELLRNNPKRLSQLYDDMLKLLFHLKTSKALQFIEIANADGEVGLKFDTEYFGLINIGDQSSFLKLVSEEEQDLFIIGQKSNFEKSLFHKIESKNSQINFLIGSKKFIEGWNSFRVSSMGLLNIGKREGVQIIQLFGRGVRLWGHNNSLKRSYRLENENQLPADIKIPPNLSLLETLNIFGLNANYMTTFRETLKEEGIEEYEKIILKIKPSIPSRALYVPRCDEGGSDFASSVLIDTFNQQIPPIRIDLSSKIDILVSQTGLLQVHADSPLKENTIDEDILSVLDFQEIYIELLKYKDLKKYVNMYFTQETLRDIIKSKQYRILCKKEILQLANSEELSKIARIQNYAIQILKSYLDKVYNHEKYAWYQENLRYETVSQEDSSLIPREYVFTINANAQTLIRDIRDFTNKLRSFVRVNSDDKETLYEQNLDFLYQENRILQFFSLHVHLFKPLIYKSQAPTLEFIKISPVNLVESERDFVKQLEKYLDEGGDKLDFEELYLLRNPSRKGVAFFETKNFYPDFILWMIKKKEQTLVFIDPHGLGFVSPDDEKLKLYEDIKVIESELKKKTKLNINLYAFILSPTPYIDLKWKVSKEDLLKKNILFLEDEGQIISQIFEHIS